MTKFSCPSCFSKLYFSINYAQCTNCSERYKLINESIPIFYDGDETSTESRGIMSSLFESPYFYKKVVQFKRLISPDKFLTEKNFYLNKSLLNVGCGSSINAEHLEYEITDLLYFAGVDVSRSFIVSASSSYSIDNSEFAIASAAKLPYEDSNFDIVILPFVLHHLPFDISFALQEAFRVSKQYVVIFDHILHEEKTIKNSIQKFYLTNFDGGFNYLTEAEWGGKLNCYNVISSLKTGALFKHVYKLVIKK